MTVLPTPITRPIECTVALKRAGRRTGDCEPCSDNTNTALPLWNSGIPVYSFSATDLSSVNDSTPARPNSRPQPDSRQPPKGMLGSTT